MSSAVNSPAHRSPAPETKKNASPIPCQPIFIVDTETASVDLNSNSVWDDELGIIALRKYYALRNEAQYTVVESKRTWEDTPFSVFAVQCEHLHL
jgi:serine/arginine repetitive matrix protein 2